MRGCLNRGRASPRHYRKKTSSGCTTPVEHRLNPRRLTQLEAAQSQSVTQSVTKDDRFASICGKRHPDKLDVVFAIVIAGVAVNGGRVTGISAGHMLIKTEA